MNNKTQKLFESVEVPEVKLAAHQKTLRRNLLHIYMQQNRKGGEKAFMKRKLFRYGAIGFVSLALVIAFAITTILPKTSQVQAQEIVNNAMDYVVKLSDEERKVIEGKIKADLEGSLEEAKQAKDLTVVPEEEIERVDMAKDLPKGNPGEKGLFMIKRDEKIDNKEEPKSGAGIGGVSIGNTKPGEMAPGFSGQFPGKIMAPHGVKVLSYTSPEGNKVILGINEQNEPVLKMVHMSKENGKQMNVHFEKAF